MRSVRTLKRYALAGEHGKDWYTTAELAIRRRSDDMGWNPQRFADILALTSPRVSVSRNARLAIRYMARGDTSGLMRSIRTSLDTYERTGRIHGPKTRAFALALMGEPDAIVLDTWMAKALDTDPVFTVAVRREAEVRIRKVASALNWTPAQVQAAIWTHWYEDAGRKGATTAPRIDAYL